MGDGILIIIMQIGANWRMRWIVPGVAAMVAMYKTAEPIKMQLTADSSGQKNNASNRGAHWRHLANTMDSFLRQL